jgi:hypothetical protein
MYNQSIQLTLLMMAMDAYALPKLTPITAGPFLSGAFSSGFAVFAAPAILLEGYGRLIYHKFWTQTQGLFTQPLDRCIYLALMVYLLWGHGTVSQAYSLC